MVLGNHSMTVPDQSIPLDRQSCNVSHSYGMLYSKSGNFEQYHLVIIVKNGTFD